MIRWLLPTLIVLVGFAAPLYPAEAKSYRFSRVEIDATVGPDGSMRIAERRTYFFDGSFRRASYRLRMTGASDIRNIRIADERGGYSASTSGQPGTFRVSRETDAVQIEWFYSANNEQRTFTISYDLTDVVTVHQDVAELYWNFIGTGWDVGSDEVQVAVRLPAGARRDEVRAWGHGPLQGAVEVGEWGALLKVRKLPPKTAVEGRVVFPRRLVPAGRNQSGRTALEAILSQETGFAAQANRERRKARVTTAALIIYPLVLLVAAFDVYRRHGREPSPTVPREYYRELPGTYPPAELGALWRFRKVTTTDFVATVVDLARRGFLKITEDPRPGQRYLIEPTYGSQSMESGKESPLPVEDSNAPTSDDEGPADLLPLERRALWMLFGKSRSPVQISVSGLEGGVKTRLQTSFRGWAKLVAESARRHEFFDEGSGRMRQVLRAGGVVLAAASLIVFSSLPPFWAMIGAETIPLGIFLTVVSFAFDRRTQRGADELQRWRGFKQFLADFSEMERQPVPALSVWEHYLVYAIPLGVADRVLAQLRALIPAADVARDGAIHWYSSTSHGTARGSSVIDGLSTFTSTFTSTVAAAASPSSSGSGGGGGFSGGGGGGGGGGGSGGSAS